MSTPPELHVSKDLIESLKNFHKEKTLTSISSENESKETSNNYDLSSILFKHGYKETSDRKFNSNNISYYENTSYLKKVKKLEHLFRLSILYPEKTCLDSEAFNLIQILKTFT